MTYPIRRGWVSVFQCPVCGELMEALTNFHCTSRHGMSRREIVNQYGLPKYVAPMMRSDVQQWIRKAQVITRIDFDVAQAAVRSQLRHGS